MSDSPPVVLVVDDDRGIRSLLTDILGDLGYETIAADDGAAGIAALRAAKGPIAIAIVDLVMPGGMGGIETLHALRDVQPGLPGIVSTGYEDQLPEGDISLAEAGRRDGFETLTKPYKIDDLERALERARGGR